MEKFQQVEFAANLEAYIKLKDYAKDSSPDKVCLVIGAYRDENGLPWVMPVVRKAEKLLANNPNLFKEYLPALGLETFTSAATSLLLGTHSTAVSEGRAFGAQCVSGTGALRLGADFLHRILHMSTFYCSSPTWLNHSLIFNDAGFDNAKTYRYWDKSTRKLDIDGLIEDLGQAPENSVIVLHTSAHNPTGCDPSHSEWIRIADTIEKRKLFPFFDTAYQGYASGDLDSDVWAVRYFESRKIPFFCAQSFSKNFGLYNERVGNLVVVLNTPSNIPQIKSQLELIVCGLYTNPPSHGALIVAEILNNQTLRAEWISNLREMAARTMFMRKHLRSELEKLKTPGDWSHITNQIGMFSYTGLNENQSERMIRKYHIYMLKSGRICVSALTLHNVGYVARAIHETVNNDKNILHKL